MKILVFAALRGEIWRVMRQLRAQSAEPVGGRRTYKARTGGKNITIALTGMGTKNASLSAGLVLPRERPDIVLNAGFAGALYPGARHGDIVCPERTLLYPEGKTLYISGGGTDYESLLAKMPDKEKVKKRGLAVTLSRWEQKPGLEGFLTALDFPPARFPVCDMETFTLARAALETGAAFLGIRAISDVPGEELGFDPLDIADANGQISTRRAALKFMAVPRLIPQAMRLWKNSKAAAQSLTETLVALVESL